MLKKFLCFLIVPFILAGCSSDEPELDLFHLTLGMEGDADVSMGTHSADITINGYARWIEVGIVGDFDSYILSDDYPAWLTITDSEMIAMKNYFRINVTALDGADSRVGKIGFTVFKGTSTQSGSITITQNACTIEDLKKTEWRAMKKYLSKFDVIDKVPAVNDIQVGSVAPFYKLNPEATVYMQVVSKGTGPTATAGEKVYFRYLRYNLLSYLENNVLPKGEGNLNSITQDATFFELGSNNPATTRWGTAIQMPLLLGLPVDSEVNLVVASEAGPTSEISAAVPFLYNIRYLKSE